MYDNLKSLNYIDELQKFRQDDYYKQVLSHLYTKHNLLNFFFLLHQNLTKARTKWDWA